MSYKLRDQMSNASNTKLCIITAKYPSAQSLKNPPNNLMQHMYYYTHCAGTAGVFITQDPNRLPSPSSKWLNTIPDH